MLTVLLRMYLVPSGQSCTSETSAGQYVFDQGKKKEQVSGVLSKCMHGNHLGLQPCSRPRANYMHMEYVLSSILDNSSTS